MPSVMTLAQISVFGYLRVALVDRRDGDHAAGGGALRGDVEAVDTGLPAEAAGHERQGGHGQDGEQGGDAMHLLTVPVGGRPR